jgi:hypothetical protein
MFSKINVVKYIIEYEEIQMVRDAMIKRHWPLRPPLFKTAFDHYVSSKIFYGGMTMRPQTKRPWSFQPWTMSLSGQYVPRLKLINGFYVTSIFGPCTFHPSQYSPFFGILWQSLIFHSLIIIFGHCVPTQNTYGFLWRGKLSKFKLSTYYLAEMFAYKIVPYYTQ